MYLCIYLSLISLKVLWSSTDILFFILHVGVAFKFETKFWIPCAKTTWLPNWQNDQSFNG